MADRLGSSATVKTVYGEPVSVEGKTIIPVAKVRYGFGAGGGSHTQSSDEHQGGGGGGGVEVTPIGIIEITPCQTRYISLEDNKRLVRGLIIGVAIVGLLIYRRRRKRRQ